MSNYNDFDWTCPFCEPINKYPAKLAEISHKRSMMRIYSNNHKIISIDSNGVVEIVCPKCYAINRSTDRDDVKFFCETLFSGNKNGVDIKPTTISCSARNGCGHVQFAKLLESPKRTILSIAGHNGKLIRFTTKEIVFGCPECKEITIANKFSEVKKFWDALVPEPLRDEEKVKEVIIS
jgi:phage FluMu protein Com